MKSKRCANNKIDHFSSKKFQFWAKKRRKNGFFGVFGHYFRKTFRIFAVLPQLSSNLQGRRLLKSKKCAKNKVDHFSSKKFQFWAKKRRKNGFFGVFGHYFRKTFRIFAVLPQLSSNLQGRRPLGCKMWANNKRDHFSSKKLKFWAKKRRKNEFFVFPSGKRSAYLLCCLIELKQNRLLYSKKFKFWAKKRRKNGFFWGFSTLLRENASQICCIAPIELAIGFPIVRKKFAVCKRWQIIK